MNRGRVLPGLFLCVLPAALACDAPRNDSVSSPAHRPGETRTIAGVEFAWCPPGSFRMGSGVDDPDHRGDEEPVTVSFRHGFWMGRYEVTQGEWRRVIGAFPDREPSAEFGIGDTHPVYWVDHGDALAFSAALESRARAADELEDTWTVTLPTEAEWEYACRAGTATATAFGDSLGHDGANFAGKPVGGLPPGAPPGLATPVGSYPSNRWGLHDMHGNVWEWCRDWYHGRLPGGIDPDLSETRGAENRDGTYSRVRRGGAFVEDGWACRSATRLRYEPDRTSDHIGFRVAVVQRKPRSGP